MASLVKWAWACCLAVVTSGAANVTLRRLVNSDSRLPTRQLTATAAEVNNLFVTTLATGKYHSCAIRESDRELLCWGQDTDGQATVPANLVGQRISHVACGGYHTCAITEVGNALTCWGWNDDGQTTVPNIGSVAQVVTGHTHTCAVLVSDGSVECWGANADGQTDVPATIRNGGAGGQNVPVKRVEIGYFHTCAVDSNSALLCWGKNTDGQATVPGDLGSVDHAVLGFYHTCAILSGTNTMQCWGSDADGRLAVAGDLGAVSGASAYHSHTCVILAASSELDCWGVDEQGQSTVSPTLGQVDGVAAGGFHTCTIQATDRNANCWGLNDDGQTDPPAALGRIALNADPVVTGASATTLADSTGATTAQAGTFYWAEDRCGIVQMEATYLHETADAAVRCCSPDGSSGDTPTSCIIGSYASAMAECEANGMRLCSAEELHHTCNSGCAFDDKLVWTNQEQTSEFYWVEDVCGATDVQPLFQAEEEVAGVRCCVEDGTSGSTPTTCLMGTYNEAVNECKNNNMRLCHKLELKVTCDTGCGFEDKLVWTSDQQASHWVDDKCGAAEFTPKWQEETLPAAVRCCSADGATGMTPSSCLQGTYTEAVALCSDNGLRLCTPDELINACDGQCGFDAELVWTMDKQDPENYWVEDACGTVDMEAEYRTETDMAAVRCCNTDGTSGSSSATCLVTNYVQALTECAKNDMRLCSPQELPNACDGQCGFDSQLVWTSHKEASQYYWTEDACGRTQYPATFKEHSDSAGTRCCSEDGTTGSSPTSCIYGTYEEAVAECSANGLRLCTPEELPVTCYTGCDFDRVLIWSDLKQDPKAFFAADACGANDFQDTYLDEDLGAGVRCCSADGLTGSTPSSCLIGTYEQAISECAKNSQRLCTPEELVVTCDTGCGLDNRLVWTSQEETSDSLWVADACGEEDIEATYLDEEREAAVRCCSEDGATGMTPTSCLLGTYEEAVAECEANGMRICTADELAVTCDTGCGFETRLVWTNQTKVPTEYWVEDACGIANSPAKYLDEKKSAAVRCCDLNGTAGTSPTSCLFGTYAEAVNECSANGMRLCSPDELPVSCATGCNFDTQVVWTNLKEDPESYWVEDVCEAIEAKGQYQTEGMVAAVRCCGGAVNGTVTGLTPTPCLFLNHDQAVQECLTNGMRLCTPEELPLACNSATGSAPAEGDCSSDTKLVWTNRPDEDTYWAEDACGAVDVNATFLEESKEAAVRCCSYDGASGMTPSACIVGTYAVAVAECANNNMRLCTADELPATCDTGCGFEGDLVWTGQPEESYWVEDACGPVDLEAAYLEENLYAAVRCCNTDGTSGVTPSACLRSTYAEALATCTAEGMRLCAPDELPVACDTGCGFEDNLVWTSDMKDSDSQWAEDACGVADVQATYLDESMESAAVRCCSADGTSGMTPSVCLIGNYRQAVAECRKNAMRLCTPEELSNTCDTGCAFEDQLVWTKRPEESESYWVEDACGAVDKEPVYLNEAMSAAIRCCSPDGSSGISPSVCLIGTYEMAVATCAANSMRLCSPTELPNACDGACGFDTELVWTDQREASVWVEDACGEVNYQATYLDESLTAAVRCCSADGSTGMTPSSCLKTTYYQAVSECTSNSMRLCSPTELPVTCDTGCGFETELVWTGSEDTDTYWAEDACGAADVPATFLDRVTGSAAARCCSADGSSGITPSECVVGNYQQALELCESNSMRLCTASELAVTCNTGCDFEQQLVWTSGQEDPPETDDIGNFWVQDKCGTVQDQGAYQDASMTAAARCCSLDGTTGMTPSECVYGTYKEASNICVRNRMRLCTPTELALTCDTGCGFENVPVWTTEKEATTPLEDTYWAEDACGNTDVQATYLDAEAGAAAVRCCSADGTTGMTPTVCLVGNYLEAVTECTNNGMRLCSPQELEVACDTGCNFENQLVWTDRPEDPEFYWAEDACGVADEAAIYLSESKSAAVRCCSADGSTGMTPSACIIGTYAQAVATCAANSMRLCSPAELANACDGACGFDTALVWTDQREATFWVEDGCGQVDQQARYLEESMSAAVRCCSADGTTGATPSTCVKAPYWEAVNMCESNNMRLCAPDELTLTCNRCPDTELVWTGTKENDLYWAEDACGATDIQPSYLDRVTGSAAVRCCSGDGTTGMTPSECLVGNYKQAVELCQLNGMRLCSPTELANTCDTGCGFENQLVWTNGPQDTDALTWWPWVQNACAGQIDDGSYLLESDNAAVRCCSMDGTTGMTPSICLVGSYRQAIDECIRSGMRLCSPDELSNTCNTGCNFENTSVWTSQKEAIEPTPIPTPVPTNAPTLVNSPTAAPTPAPPTEDFYWVEDVCGSADVQARYLDAAAGSAAVRCCSDDGTQGMTPAVCLIGSYEEAVAQCQANNMRLCSPQELKTTCDSGCNFEDNLVWTNKPQEPEFYWVTDSCGAVDKEPLYLSEKSTAAVRCCSQDGSSGATPSTCLIGTYAQAVATCSANNMRLCSPTELPALCDSTCGFDTELVWTDEREDTVWAEDVCGATNQQATYLPESVSAAVRCCSADGTTGMTPQSCLRTTYYGAVAECSSNSMRLCSPEELPATCDTGCGFETDLVWTGSPDSDMYWVADSCGSTDMVSVYLDRVNGAAAVRCCSPDGMAGMTPDVCLIGNYKEAVALCEAYGARLCSASELPTTCDTGCGFENQLVWTSGQQDDDTDFWWVQDKCGTDQDQGSYIDESAIAAARCCSMDGTTGMTPNICLIGTFQQAVDACIRNNMRLCSPDELSLTCDTGCNFENRSVWTNQKQATIPTEDVYWAQDSCDEVEIQPSYLDATSGSAAVRCCSADGTQGMTPPTCLVGNYFAAVQECANNNMRLCTPAELSVTCDTGCGFENRLVWTNRPDSEFYWVEDACGTMDQQPVFLSETQTAAVRCCSQDGTTGASDSLCLVGTYEQAVATCAANSMRLCDSNELPNACDGQCGFDNQLVWTRQREASHWVEDACDEVNYQARYLGESLSAAVRCCSADGTTGFSPETCLYTTYYKAVAECAANNMRLCAPEELPAACDTGCQFDRQLVWTGSKDSDSFLAANACGTSGGSAYLDRVDDTAAMRCCSIDGNSGMTPDVCLIGTYEQAVTLCSLSGMRLCTPDEVGSTCGTGCDFDDQPVWTSGTEDPDPWFWWVQTSGCANDGGSGGSYVDNSGLAAVRCCDALGTTGMTPDICLIGTYEQAIELCILNNMRLCSAAELSVTCNTGCNFDNQTVWTNERQGQAVPTPAPTTASGDNGGGAGTPAPTFRHLEVDGAHTTAPLPGVLIALSLSVAGWMQYLCSSLQD